jgi:hypothetical protein
LVLWPVFERIERHIVGRTLAGLLALIPLIVTIVIIFVIIGRGDGAVQPFVERHPWDVPSIGLLLLMAICYAIGLLVSTMPERKVMEWTSAALNHISIGSTIASGPAALASAEPVAPGCADHCNPVLASTPPGSCLSSSRIRLIPTPRPIPCRRALWVRGIRRTRLIRAIGYSYSLTSSEEGQTVQVRVSFTDDGGNSESLTSKATGAVAANSPATGAPPIPCRRALWVRGIRRTRLIRAIGYSYSLTSSEEGQTVQVRVSFTDDGGNSESLTSKATGAVAANSPATGAPILSGTAQVDEMLSADTSRVTAADGLDNATFSYQWMVSDGNTDTDIEDATESTYTPSEGDVGKTIKVWVRFTYHRGNAESLTSEAAAEQETTIWSAELTAGEAALSDAALSCAAMGERELQLPDVFFSPSLLCSGSPEPRPGLSDRWTNRTLTMTTRRTNSPSPHRMGHRLVL